MTSWQRPGSTWRPAAAVAAEAEGESPKAFFYQTMDGNPGVEFLNLLFAYLYCQKQKGVLHVLDLSDPIRPLEGFYASSFEELPGLRFVDSRVARAQNLAPLERAVLPAAALRSIDELRAGADVVFRLKKARVAELLQRMSRMSLRALRVGDAGVGGQLTQYRPETFNVGVYLPEGAGRGGGASAGVPATLAALRDIQAKQKLPELHIFVVGPAGGVADTVLGELKRGLGASWTLYTPLARMPNESNSARVRRRDQLDGWGAQLAELSVLQNLPNLVLPLSSGVGKFLFLTAADGTAIRGIDGASFSVYSGIA